jgi:hypothetical protein
MVSDNTYGTQATQATQVTQGTNGHGPALHVHSPSDATVRTTLDRDLPAPPSGEDYSDFEPVDEDRRTADLGGGDEEDPYDGIEDPEEERVWTGSKIPVRSQKSHPRDTLPPSPKPSADVPEVSFRCFDALLPSPIRLDR